MTFSLTPRPPMVLAQAHDLLPRRRLLGLAASAALAGLAGCAGVTKVSGAATVGERVVLNLDHDWNQVNLPGAPKHMAVWTQDGLPLDVLQLWVAVADGQKIDEAPKDKRPLVFRANMTPHELAGLFEAWYGRDGSTFTLTKLAPGPFLGRPGVQFEFEVLRKADDVRTAGIAWAAVVDQQLFAMTFTAPRLGFFPRHRAKVVQAASNAQLKG